jgi:hypothetical protein
MPTKDRLHPGQLAILWAVAAGVLYFLSQILNLIDIPTVPIGQTSNGIRTVQENWISGPGFAYTGVISLMIATTGFVLVKTWRWFGVSRVSDSNGGEQRRTMPLIPCPDCGKEISDLAPACIHCGRPMDEPPTPPAAEVVPDPYPPPGFEEPPQPVSKKTDGNRFLAGFLGGVLGLVLFALARTGDEGFMMVLIAGLATMIGTTFAWVVSRSLGSRLRWFHVMIISIGLTIAILTAFMLGGLGPSPDLLGYVFGLGLSYGSLCGGCASLFLFAFSGDSQSGSTPPTGEWRK